MWLSKFINESIFKKKKKFIHELTKNLNKKCNIKAICGKGYEYYCYTLV